MRAQGVDITKEQAGQVTTKEECDRFISAVISVISRDNKYIAQREQEVVRLKEILETLKQRQEFLTYGDGIIEPNQWYEQRRYGHPCRTIKVENDVVVFLQFEMLKISGDRYYSRSKNYVLIPFPTGEVVLNPLIDSNNNIIGLRECCKITPQTEHIRHRGSFLENWIPSNKLQVMIKNPIIVEVDSLAEEMRAQKSPHSLLDEEGDVRQRSLTLAKYNDRGWHIVFSMESGL